MKNNYLKFKMEEEIQRKLSAYKSEKEDRDVVKTHSVELKHPVRVKVVYLRVKAEKRYAKKG